MKFKIGDKVMITGDLRSTDYLCGLTPAIFDWQDNKIMLEVVEINYQGMLKLTETHRCSCWLSPEDLSFCGHPINPLNRILYPDYVEEDGLLVPRR
jgi:hypothetical protein